MEAFETYNRSDIMALQGEYLLEYVNYMLGKGYSFEKLCQEKKLRNKTIRGRLKEQCGAVYNQKLKRYVINTSEIHSEPNSVVIETPKETQKVIQKVLSKETDKEYQKNPFSPGVLSNEDTEVINSLKEAILGLTSELATLNANQPLQQLQGAKNTVKTDDNTDFNVLNLNGEVKNRPMKLYPEVLNRLDAFCDKYPQYSKQRIISTLLMEAMDKYTE